MSSGDFYSPKKISFKPKSRRLDGACLPVPLGIPRQHQVFSVSFQEKKTVGFLKALVHIKFQQVSSFGNYLGAVCHHSLYHIG